MVVATWYEAVVSTSRHQACLLLGSNIEPDENIPLAIRLLKTQVAILKVSSVWESASVECCYPNFLNLAALVETEHDARELKWQVLRPLEARMGRVRTDDKNAPRTIDLDIVLFDGKVMDADLWLQVHRATPVAELFPDFRSETGEALQEVAMRLQQSTGIQVRRDISVSLD